MNGLVAYNMYAVCSLKPYTDEDMPLGTFLYCCLPCDFGNSLKPAEGLRYVSLVLVPLSYPIGHLYDETRHVRPYSHQWITYCEQVMR